MIGVACYQGNGYILIYWFLLEIILK
jgi:hypothetical protein